MNFASDNSGPVHPQVMAALNEANAGYALPYGADDHTARAVQMIRDTFEAPDAAVYLVSLGTAANSLILATLTKPWETVFCHRMSHIHEDECNAPEFYSGGAKLTIVDGPDAKMTPKTLRSAIEAEETRGVHRPQRGPVSITSVTERGTVYSLDEIRALSDVAHDYGLPFHLDGARFANAMMALGCSAADMSWKAGADAVSFGGTKNGLMAVEAAVFFDPKYAWEFELRRKRGAQLFSKHRFLAAQMQAYLTDDLWKTMATAANASCARLATGLRQSPDASIDFEPQGNVIFAHISRAGHQRLHAAGAQYYVLGGDYTQGDPADMLPARMVCDWSMTSDGVDAFLAALRG